MGGGGLDERFALAFQPFNSFKPFHPLLNPPPALAGEERNPRVKAIGTSEDGLNGGERSAAIERLERAN